MRTDGGDRGFVPPLGDPGSPVAPDRGLLLQGELAEQVTVVSFHVDSTVARAIARGDAG